MELNFEQQKEQFLDICRNTILRDGLEDLLDWLMKADFFTAPASTKYHERMPEDCVNTHWMFMNMRRSWLF